MAASPRPDEQHRQAGVKEGAGRTLAQVSSLVGGLVLIAIGVLGFFFGGNDFGRTRGSVRRTCRGFRIAVPFCTTSDENIAYCSLLRRSTVYRMRYAAWGD